MRDTRRRVTFGCVGRAHREGDFDGRRPAGWLGLLRAARLGLHGAELRALRELDVVHALFEARGPEALSCLAARHYLWRGLSLRAEVTLLDEPLTGFDSDHRRHFVVQLPRLLRAFAGTVVVVTHDSALAGAIADEQVVLVAGRVES